MLYSPKWNIKTHLDKRCLEDIDGNEKADEHAKLDASDSFTGQAPFVALVRKTTTKLETTGKTRK